MNGEERTGMQLRLQEGGGGGGQRRREGGREGGALLLQYRTVPMDGAAGSTPDVAAPWWERYSNSQQRPAAQS